MIGRTVGPYCVRERLGSGDAGEAYLADDARATRPVMLRQVPESWLARPGARERLEREVQLVAGLRHPNIAAVVDVVDIEGQPYLVTEHVEGEPLEARLRRGRLPLKRAVEIGIAITDAVVEAHAHGVLHRDLTPARVRLTPDGGVKVLDFGLARVQGAPVPAGASPLDAALRKADQVVGTPGYAAPEQMVGGTPDPHSDVYAIGVLLFEMATGRRLHPGGDPMTVTLATLTQPVPSAHSVNPRVPAALSMLIAHALEKNPELRYPSAARLRADLTRVYNALAEQAETPSGEEGWATANPPVSAPAGETSRRALLAVFVLAVVTVLVSSRWCSSP